MSNDVFVITDHMDGKFSDVSFEMVGKAKELASAFGGQAVAVVVGSGVSANVFASDSTIHVDEATLSQFNPEAYGKVIEALVKKIPAPDCSVDTRRIWLALGNWKPCRLRRDLRWRTTLMTVRSMAGR
jgi:electron transfer flavoprotein alpha subunit